jgi:hypothetical protein
VRAGWRSSTIHAPPTLPYSAVPIIYRWPVLAARFTGRARGGVVKCSCSVACRGCGMPALLRRPGDCTIGHAIGLSVHELVAASVEMAGYCALLPKVWSNGSREDAISNDGLATLAIGLIRAPVLKLQPSD